MRQAMKPPVIVLAVLVGLAGVAIGFIVAPRGSTPSPHPAAHGSPYTLPPPASVSPSSPAVLRSSAIPMDAACKWAYPGQASGEISGSDYSIVCLGNSGQVLGGFSGSHSLNAWCADPSHTSGYALPQPELIDDVWICGGSGSSSASPPMVSPSTLAPTSSAAAAQPTPSPSIDATNSSGGSASVPVPIPLGAACKWAYPGQASGKVSGSAYSIVCLGNSGQVLGGFGGSHSLNAWCADPSHTNRKHLPDPKLLKGKWVCAA
jgi:hypothetical protein